MFSLFNFILFSTSTDKHTFALKHTYKGEVCLLHEFYLFFNLDVAYFKEAAYHKISNNRAIFIGLLCSVYRLFFLKWTGYDIKTLVDMELTRLAILKPVIVIQSISYITVLLGFKYYGSSLYGVYRTRLYKEKVSFFYRDFSDKTSEVLIIHVFVELLFVLSVVPYYYGCTFFGVSHIPAFCLAKRASLVLFSVVIIWMNLN